VRVTRTLTEFDGLIAYLSETPAAIGRMIVGLADEDRRWKPTGAEFSLLENVCHLLDIEREGYAVRIERLLEEDGPTLADLDGSRLARERDYNNQNMEEALEEFARARDGNVRVAEGLSAAQLERPGTLETVGPITLGGLFSMMRAHDEAHRREIEELRWRLLARKE
jgi:hypothetical protein